MRPYIYLLLFVAVLFSCKSNKKQTTKDLVTVSIIPQKYLVEQIADTLFDVNVLIPAGSAPATYEPTPRQMSELSKSVIYFRIGHIGFEQAWMDKIASNNPELPIINCSKNQDLIYAKAHRHGDHMHYEGTDPHIWLSPDRLKTQAEIIFNKLVKIAPEHKDIMQKNYNNLITKLTDTDKKLKEMFKGDEGSKFIIFHPALTYFAKDYSLVQIPMEIDGKTPTPVYLQQIVDKAKAEGITTVFIQKEFDKENAKLLAEEIGGEVIVINPLDGDLINNIEDIAEKLKHSLKR
ncbi:MAG: zinc ABC transporter substrate-binding protein [Bacteroidales bacterium]|jgi:zinc transport system substrate-binding protein|nr:zinc ABC transporter substrate-binding protein [Bacteroidales bacterium]